VWELKTVFVFEFFLHLLFRVAQNREAATARDIKGESSGRVRGEVRLTLIFFLPTSPAFCTRIG